MVLRYEPENLTGDTVERLVEQTDRENRRIADALSTVNDWEPSFDFETEKPRTGQVRYFDEAVYEPGVDGSGLYIYIVDTWYRFALIGSGIYGGTMLWKSRWSSGATYYPHDVVEDSGWAMVANKETTDRAAPQEQGASTYDLPTTPAWVGQAFVGVTYSGHDYVFTQPGWLVEVQVWAPVLTGSTNYRILIFDNTDPANPTVSTIEEPVLNLNAWTTVAQARDIIPVGTNLTVILDALDSGASSSWQHLWNYAGPSNAGVPAIETWNNRVQQDVIRFNYTAADGDRTTELNTIIVGSTIRCSDTGDLNAYWEYHVDAITHFATYVVFDVTLAETGINGGVPVGVSTLVDATIPTAQSTQYEELVGGVPTPAWATVEGRLRLGGVDQAVTGNAYGVRLLFQPAYVSADWDYLSYSDVSRAGASAKGQNVLTYDVSPGVSATSGDSVEFRGIATGIDILDQVPLGIGIANQMQISFGPPSLLIDAAGTFTCPNSAQYSFTFLVNAVRTNAGGTAQLWYYSTRNGVQSSQSHMQVLDVQRQRETFSFTIFERLLRGDEVKFFMYRDSGGMNEGYLNAVPNPDGLNASPSAFLEVVQLNNAL